MLFGRKTSKEHQLPKRKPTNFTLPPAIQPSHPKFPIQILPSKFASLPTFQPTQIFWPRIRGKQNLEYTGFAEGTLPEDSPFASNHGTLLRISQPKKVPTAHFQKIGVLMLMFVLMSFLPVAGV